jgi:hypothetical protein
MLTFVLVKELYTFSVGSSAEARGGDQVGCCAEVCVDICDAFLDDNNAGLQGTRLELQRGTRSIRLRRNAGFVLGKMKII